MRYESSVTSLSWIPSEAVTGATRTAFDSGFTHYDDPPPAEFADIDAELRGRLAGELRQGEQILVALQGLGSAMVVTEERVIVLREGGQARPRTGIRTYTLDQIRGVDLVPPRFRAGRIDRKSTRLNSSH